MSVEALNMFIQEKHFRMDGLYVVRDLVRQGDWLAKIDLKDAYFLIPSLLPGFSVVHLGGVSLAGSLLFVRLQCAQSFESDEISGGLSQRKRKLN